MNGVDWRTLWDVELIARDDRARRRERARIEREAGVVPARMLAPLWRTLGGTLIAAGQRLAAEPGGTHAHAPSAI